MKHALTLRSLLKIAGPISAVRFRWAARRDERNGFLLTAAMEWRKAAELSEPIALLADRCWREWERLMRLPRHLAAAIGVASVAACARRGLRNDDPTECDPAQSRLRSFSVPRSAINVSD